MSSRPRPRLRQRQHNSLRTHAAMLAVALLSGCYYCVEKIHPTEAFVCKTSTFSPRHYWYMQAIPKNTEVKEIEGTHSRREALEEIVRTLTMGALALTTIPLKETNATENDELLLKDARSQIETARSQLLEVPQYLDKQQWDSVRALLLKPPLSDCWNKRQPVLLQYAEALGNTPEGDELAALEFKEEAASHLRFLDMAVYNNVFNPIATEGESGATKELIRSYYEDPKNEYKASLQALDELLKLSPSQ